jgi:hypothetical protein
MALIDSPGAPKWALRLVEAVCLRYHVRQPSLRWRKALDYPNAAFEALGDYNMRTGGMIIYEAGSKQENRIDLLHELAHHIHFLRTGRDDHSEGFWRYCWTLYLLYGVRLHAAVLSEFSYMARSEKVLLEMGVRMSWQARLAAQLGRTMRKNAAMRIRIRRLHARLGDLRSERKKSSAREDLRSLKQVQAHTEKAVARHALAYKRVAKA